MCFPNEGYQALYVGGGELQNREIPRSLFNKKEKIPDGYLNS